MVRIYVTLIAAQYIHSKCGKSSPRNYFQELASTRHEWLADLADGSCKIMQQVLSSFPDERVTGSSVIVTDRAVVHRLLFPDKPAPKQWKSCSGDRGWNGGRPYSRNEGNHYALHERNTAKEWRRQFLERPGTGKEPEKYPVLKCLCVFQGLCAP